MPKRQNILTNLKADMDSNFTVDNGYSKVYQIRVGVYDPGDFPAYPSLGIWILDDKAREDLMDNTVFRQLNMVIYGHVSADMMNNYTSFYALISDVEKFLYSTDNRVYKNVILGDVEITYGGATNQTGMFVLNFSILYSQSGLES